MTDKIRLKRDLGREAALQTWQNLPHQNDIEAKMEGMYDRLSEVGDKEGRLYIDEKVQEVLDMRRRCQAQYDTLTSAIEELHRIDTMQSITHHLAYWDWQVRCTKKVRDEMVELDVMVSRTNRKIEEAELYVRERLPNDN